MKKFLSLLILFAAFASIAMAQQEPKSMRLVWSDEFDIDGRPSMDWTFQYGFQRNHEAQWYQSQNAFVKDGCLVIEGRREHRRNPNYVAGSSDWRTNREFIEYTSSCLTTQLSHQFLYGRFEIRAKIPTATGAWPAIWLLGNKWEWPQNGEIDIMEYYIKNGQPSIKIRNGLISFMSGVWTGMNITSESISTMNC